MKTLAKVVPLVPTNREAQLNVDTKETEPLPSKIVISKPFKTTVKLSESEVVRNHTRFECTLGL